MRSIRICGSLKRIFRKLTNNSAPNVLIESELCSKLYISSQLAFIKIIKLNAGCGYLLSPPRVEMMHGAMAMPDVEMI